MGDKGRLRKHRVSLEKGSAMNVIIPNDKFSEMICQSYIKGREDILASFSDALAVLAFQQQKREWTIEELIHLINTLPPLNEEQMVAKMMESMK